MEQGAEDSRVARRQHSIERGTLLGGEKTGAVQAAADAPFVNHGSVQYDERRTPGDAILRHRAQGHERITGIESAVKLYRATRVPIRHDGDGGIHAQVLGRRLGVACHRGRKRCTGSEKHTQGRHRDNDRRSCGRQSGEHVPPCWRRASEGPARKIDEHLTGEYGQGEARGHHQPQRHRERDIVSEARRHEVVEQED